jgi:hypothetical protein
MKKDLLVGTVTDLSEAEISHDQALILFTHRSVHTSQAGNGSLFCSSPIFTLVW